MIIMMSAGQASSQEKVQTLDQLWITFMLRSFGVPFGIFITEIGMQQY